MMTQKEMLDIVRAQLAVDLNCRVGDLNDETDRITFVEAKENPGRRPFQRKARWFEIVSMGKSIVVSATPERLSIARTQMQGKDRDTVFSLPFIRGLYLHFLPDLKILSPLSPPEGFTFEVVEHEQTMPLFDTSGFRNAIIHDRNHPYQTDLAMLAKKGSEIVGVAGVAKTCARLCQIGVDVLPAYRSHGLAVYLVNSLTHQVLERGCVPSYDCISSNLASQRVAHGAGFYIAWVSDWRCDFSGLET